MNLTVAAPEAPRTLLFSEEERQFAFQFATHMQQHPRDYTLTRDTQFYKQHDAFYCSLVVVFASGSADFQTNTPYTAVGAGHTEAEAETSAFTNLWHLFAPRWSYRFCSNTECATCKLAKRVRGR